MEKTKHEDNKIKEVGDTTDYEETPPSKLEKGPGKPKTQKQPKQTNYEAGHVEALEVKVKPRWPLEDLEKLA